jgi:hypothetical protein
VPDPITLPPFATIPPRADLMIVVPEEIVDDVVLVLAVRSG